MKRIVLLCLLLLSLFALNVTLPETTATVEAYECKPAGTRYCRRNVDCRAAGAPGVPAEWEICSFGCCRCAG